MPAPGANVTVTIEVGYCPFCRRTRNLRREERHLGGLVRTTIECESCHQVLAAKRFRSVGRWELAGAIWLPSLVAIMVVGQWTNAPAPMALAAVVLTFLALLAFALGGGRRLRLK